ncbi:DUF2298 domain-containing protein [Natrinema salaciae]|uniref:Chlor_Arch_YYY domain-containing protein n=1 Tax=Natrinema salaciae TaxID=1186196 RepID=A0A1H9MVC1_9EURY|nr:DUF2298 domain-containing protein [Natrinema salaciae]SER27656.1 Chlor_Arch_YYY domain-containing protein [Natrinema salaciae]
MEWGLVILWLAAFQLLTLLGAPLAAWLLPHFPDRGLTVALPLSLVIFTLLAFWIGQITFSNMALGGGLLGLGLVIAVAVRRGQRPMLDWRSYIESLLVFTVAFSFLIAIRAVDPAVTPQGGEAFLDFGILQSLLRSEQLPPEDMWFAGEPIQYYYGGHLITALLSRLTGTPGRYSYNLALAGFYAMLVTSAYGVARAIADTRGVPPRTAGVFAAFFVGFASNLYTPVGLLLRLLPDTPSDRLIDFFGVDPNIVPTLYPFDIGPPTRVIGDTINEFPLYGFVHGDLHAYLTSTPFLVLTVALLLAYYQTPVSARQRRWLLLGSTVPVIGVTMLIDTWSFPTACGLVFVTLLFAPAHPFTLLPQRIRTATKATDANGGITRPLISAGNKFALGAIVTSAIGLSSLASVLPFVIQTASSRPIGFLPERSLIGEFLLVQGAFLLIFALYFLPRVRPFLDPEGTRRLLVLFALLMGVGWFANVGVLVLVGPLLAIAALLQWETDNVDYEGVLFVAGAGLILLVEFVYLQDGAGPGRINTVFKTYFQTWILWSLAAGVILSGFIPPSLVHRRSWEGVPLRGKLAPVAVVGLLLTLSLYGGLALGTHFTRDSPPARTDDPTLDALAFVETQHPEEADAITWIDQREGQPTIVDAPGLERYRWENAPSSLTGVPTVAGWAHQIGYRDPEAYVVRIVEVRLMYTAEPAVQARLLEKYDVEYIYVGPEERERYDVVEFERRPGISTAYEDDHVTIYKVDRESLVDGE